MNAADKRRALRLQGGVSSSPQQSCGSKQKEPTGSNSNQRKAGRIKTEDCEEWIIQDNRERDKTFNDCAGPQLINLPQGTAGVIYQENCHYDIAALDTPKKAEEIKGRGLKILSKTEVGESRILYFPSFVEMSEAYSLFDKLNVNIPWRQMCNVIHGKLIPQPRMVAWFGPFPYAYSGAVLEPQEMPDDVLEIKRKMENFLAEQNIKAEFNSVLLNLYRTGGDSVAWHSDDEFSMGIHPTIASISLGEIRKFEMRRKPTEADWDPPIEYFVQLKHGSLLIMDGVMQKEWQHRVPKEISKDRKEVSLQVSLDQLPKKSIAEADLKVKFL